MLRLSRLLIHVLLTMGLTLILLFWEKTKFGNLAQLRTNNITKIVNVSLEKEFIWLDCKDPVYMMFGNEVRNDHIMIHISHLVRI